MAIGRRWEQKNSASLTTKSSRRRPPGSSAADVEGGVTGERSLADAPHRDAAAQLAVRRQLENLRSHPFLREREAAGALELHAWFYDVAKPEVYEWNADTDAFVPVVSDANQSTAGATMAGDG